MTRDLFGNVDCPQGRRQVREKPEERKRIEVPRGPPGRQQFFRVGGRSYSIAEVYDLVGFHQICIEQPDDDLVVVIDCGKPPPHAMYILAMPRNHASRFDAAGRRDRSLAPFWGHGDVMYIQGRELPK